MPKDTERKTIILPGEEEEPEEETPITLPQREEFEVSKAIVDEPDEPFEASQEMILATEQLGDLFKPEEPPAEEPSSEEIPAEKPTPTPAAQPRKKESFGEFLLSHWYLLLIGAVLITGSVLLGVFVIGWQHAVGAFGGAIFMLALFGVSYYLENEVSWEFDIYKTTAVTCAVMILCNSVLAFLFSSVYAPAFYWLQAWFLAGAVIAAIYAKVDDEGAWTFVGIYAAVAALLVLIFFALRAHFDWAKWQHVIGSTGGAGLFFLLFGIGFLRMDDVSSKFWSETYNFVNVIASVLCLANTVVAFALGTTHYGTIFLWSQGVLLFSLALAGFFAVYNDDAEMVVPSIISAIVFGVAYVLFIFHDTLSWGSWQVAIGSIGGVLLLFAIFGLSYLMVGRNKASYEESGIYKLVLIFCLVSGIVNLALYLSCGRALYGTIYAFMQGFLLAGVLSALVFAFRDDDCETNGWKITGIVGILFFAIGIGLYFVLDRLDWQERQFVLGIGGAVLLPFAVFGIGYLISYVAELPFLNKIYKATSLLAALLVIPNVVLYVTYVINYVLIFMLLQISLALIQLVSFIFSFKSRKNKLWKAFIFLALLGTLAGGFALMVTIGMQM